APARAADAAAETRPVGAGQSQGELLAVVFSPTPKLCADAAAGVQHPGGADLVLYLGELDVSTGALRAPTAPGTYAAIAALPGRAPRFALASAYLHPDQRVLPSDTGLVAVSGSVELARIGPSPSGTLALELRATDAAGHPTGASEHVSGRFEAAACTGAVAW